MPSPDYLRQHYSEIGLIPKSEKTELPKRANELVDKLSGVRSSIYIFVFEDGTFGWSRKPPTEHDILCVRDGILDILCIERGEIRQFDGNGNLVDCKELYVNNDPICGDYHSALPQH